MFGKKTIYEEYAPAIKEVEDGQRREPQHDRPKATKSVWGEVDPVDQHIFDEFGWFGATLDKSTDDAWSIEETSDITHRARYLDSPPKYGRRWNIYYNALKLGWLEVSACPKTLFGSVEEFCADPEASVDMRLDLMRFIPFGQVSDLLYQAAFLMQDVEAGYEAARERARRISESAMTRYMWDVMQDGDQCVPNLDFLVVGSYAVYREMVTHWKEVGYDPITRKRQDHPQ